MKLRVIYKDRRYYAQKRLFFVWWSISGAEISLCDAFDSIERYREGVSVVWTSEE